MPALNKRLICAANMLEKGRVTADIGTDHAFLPIYLVQNGICPKVIACDIAEKPLSTARKNIEKRGLEAQISLRLAPGLDAVKPEECSAVTITGMGGETIAEIIAAAAWLKNSRYVLILQPMSCEDRLRLFLQENGFYIEKENAVLSQGRIYTVMRVFFRGKLPAAGASFRYVGRLADNHDPLSKALLQKRLKALQKCADQLRQVPEKQQFRHEILRAAKEIALLPILNEP